MDIEIGVSYSSDLDIVENVMLKLAEDPRVHADPNPQFHVLSYGDNAIQVRLRIYVDYADMFSLNWDLKRELKKFLRIIILKFHSRSLYYIKRLDC